VLPYYSEFFDVIIALFVFHFRIESLYLSEIWRVLKHNGIFIYNTYNIEQSGLGSSLLEAGFNSIDLISGCDLPQNFSVYACIK
jgi:ubiquinone/menaquinone biosynthesis C-methylase UbiE